MRLRPHQQKALDTLLPLIEKKERISAIMIQGSGATITLASLIFEYCRSNSFDKKILIVTERRTLVYQLRKAIDDIFQGEESNRVEVETIKNLINQRKYLSFKAHFFDLICISNCQEISLSPRSEITNALSYLSPKTILGFHSFKSNQEYFGEPAFEYDYQDAIKDDINRPYIYTSIDIDFDAFKFQDYKYLEGKILPSLTGFIQDKKSVIFCRDEVLGRQINELINSHFKNAKYSFYISSKTDGKERLLSNFRSSGEPYVLVNNKILSQGIDFQNVENIVFLKKFSPNVVLQIISNFSRKNNDLEVLNIYDYANHEVDRYDWYSDSENQKTYVKHINSYKHKILIRKKRSVDPVLGAKELASEMSEIIKDLPEDQGRMIGVFGEWGRGKTFFIEEIWKKLQEQNNIERIDFHAWKYQETPAVWAYLYENFSKKYFNSKWLLTSIYRRIKLNLKRQGYFKIILFVIPLLFSIIYYLLIPFEAKINWFIWLINTAGIGFLIGSFIIYSNHKNTARELFNIYFEKISFSKVLGIQSEVQKELKYLIEAWDNKSKSLKLVLFVDDIDRCSEEKIIKIIDSLRVMLEDEYLSSKIIVVAAIDERILKRAIQHKYHNLLNRHLDGNDAQELVSEYFDKLFLLGIKLGDLNASEISEFIKELTKNDIEISNSAETDSDSKIVTDDSDDDFNEIEEFPEEGLVEIEEENDNNNGDEDHSNSIGNSEEKKLTNEEAQILFEKIKRFESATPRQIRIFYYRFQLAKNLLHMEYTKLGIDNVWAGHGNTDLFVELLVDFSKPYHPNVSDEFVKMKSYREELIYLGKDKKPVKATDYKVLLKVFNLVIAY